MAAGGEASRAEPGDRGESSIPSFPRGSRSSGFDRSHPNASQWIPSWPGVCREKDGSRPLQFRGQFASLFSAVRSFNIKSTRDTNVPQRFTVLKMTCAPYVCVCSPYFFQLEFSDDIVRIIQTAINSDGGHPESRKANSMVKSFFIRVRTSNLFRMIWYHLGVIIEQLHTLKSY